MLYCFHTAGVLHIFMLYNLLGPGISFCRKSKINVKRKANYEIGWFHMTIDIIDQWSFHIDLCLSLYKRWFSVIHFYSSNSLKSLFNSFKKFEIEMNSLGNILHIICENLYDLYTLNSLSGWKGEKIHTERFFKFPSNIYLFSMV